MANRENGGGRGLRNRPPLPAQSSSARIAELERQVGELERLFAERSLQEGRMGSRTQGPSRGRGTAENRKVVVPQERRRPTPESARTKGISGRPELRERRSVIGLLLGGAGALGAAAFLYTYGGAFVAGKSTREGGERLPAGSENTGAEARPKAKFGKWVGKPVPLRAFPILPCNKPANINRPLGWEDKYGEEGKMKTRGWSGVVTVWAHWCNPCIEELGFFKMLHEKMGMPVTGIQQRENGGGKTAESWEGPMENLYLTYVDVKGIGFPQFAMRSGDIEAMQNDVGVPEGKEGYPFNAIVVDGKIMYWANSVWNDRIWLLENPDADTGAKERVRRFISPEDEAEYRARAEEFISAARYLLGGKRG